MRRPYFIHNYSLKMRITRKVEHFHFQSDFSISKINQICLKFLKFEIKDKILLLTFRNNFAKNMASFIL